MRRFTLFRWISVLTLGLALAPALPLAAHADTVTDWNAIMQATVTAPPTNPFFQARHAAITQLAVFEAVNAIVRDYEPYLEVIDAPSWASPDAAAVAAAHLTLVTLRPDRAAALDAARALSLSRQSPTARKRTPVSRPAKMRQPLCFCSEAMIAGTPSYPIRLGLIPATGNRPHRHSRQPPWSSGSN